jgi:hemolysin activation/secretion protein
MLDHFQKATAKLGYHWLRGRNANTASVLSFDAISEKQTLDLSGTRSAFSEDQLRVIRFTQTGDIYDAFGGHLSGSATVSFGLDKFGARSATTALPMSRDGAEPSFRKLEASLHYGKSFAHNKVQFSFSAQAQTSFGDALAASEQMGLSGMSWLSAFDTGSIQADTGLVARGELAFPVALPATDALPEMSGTAAPYVFAAAGIAKLEEPTAVEEEFTRAYSVGAGVRFGLSKKESAYATTVSLEYAHGNGSGIDVDNRFNMRLISKF